jgi:hypothetical protein
MDPSDPSILYATTMTPRALFKSSDRAGSWKRLPTIAGDIEVIYLDPASPATIYALYSKNDAVPHLRLQRSDDGGATWVDLSDAGSPKTNGYFALVWFDATSTPSTVYMYGQRGEDMNVYRSTDRGDTWTRLGAAGQHKAEALQKTPRPMPAAARKALAAFLASSGPYWRLTDADTGAKVSVNFDATKAPIVDPDHPSTFYVVTREGVYKSRDGGRTWRKASAGL